ncbi:MAG: hypothetical protein AB7D37_12670 [Desulfovibrio sp.]
MIKLPTDNLYKFLTVFGLLITLNSGYYMYSYYIRLDFDLFEVGSMVKKKIEIDSPRYLVGIRKLTNKLNKASDENEKNEINRQIEELNGAYNDNNFRIVEKLNFIDLKMKDSFLSQFLAGAICSFWGGCIIMFSGFVCWYRKVQKYQDVRLRRCVALSCGGIGSLQSQSLLKKWIGIKYFHPEKHSRTSCFYFGILLGVVMGLTFAVLVR